jgi:hypothetical protein
MTAIFNIKYKVVPKMREQIDEKANNERGRRILNERSD